LAKSAFSVSSTRLYLARFKYSSSWQKLILKE